MGAALFIELAAYTGVFLVGPIVDRVGNQRTIYVVSYPIMAIAAALIGVGDIDRWLTVPLLLVLVAIVSILWDLTWAAGNAAPGLLLSRDEQFAGQGLSAVGGASAIVGYAAGGILILVSGPGGGMLLYGALLFLGAVFAIPLVIRPPPRRRETFGESLSAGWRRITGTPGRPLLQLASVDAIQGFFGAVPALLITLLATTTFRSSALAYSGLFVSYVVGGTAAGFVLGLWNPRSTVGIVLVGSLLGVAGAFGLVIVLPHFLALEVGAFLAVGFLSSAYLDAKYAFFRGTFAPDELGRLVSNMYLFPGITGSVGALILGSIANATTPPELAGIAATGFLAAGLLGLALRRVKAFHF